MARMYPTPIQPATDSEAERILYRELERQLDDTYTVIHSANWQFPDKNRRAQNGEADFIILHPEKGMLVIEVKGGSIQRDAASGQWTTVSRLGQTYLIKDPFDQARKSMYKLVADFANLPNLPRDYTSGSAVAFPESHVGNIQLGTDMPRTIILDDQQINEVATWINRVYDHYRGTKSPQLVYLGAKSVQIMRQRIIPDISIRPVLWGDIQREQQEMVRLTQEQFRLLLLLSEHHQARIKGPAGSGKTMLALEKAQQIARGGNKVLYLCFNVSLAEAITRKLGTNPPFDVKSYHSLCYEFATLAGTPPTKWTVDETYFNQILPDALIDALDTISLRYDAIIVDEGQDFRDSWWLSLQLLLTDQERSTFYVFYDDNQRIYSQDHDWPIKTAPFSLVTNCRNTQSIHRLVTKYYQGVPISVQGPAGRPIEVVRYDTSEEQVHVLGILLEKLVTRENIPTEEIVILTPFKKVNSPLWMTPLGNQFHLTENWPAEKNGIYTTTIQSFKGLESKVIILADLDRWPMQEMESLLYVACSRASHHLCVVLPKQLSVDKRSLLDFSTHK